MAKKKPVQRNTVSAEFVEDGGLAYAVDRTANGRYSVRVRVYGEVTIDGVTYTWDVDEVRVQLKRVTND